jgi:hypothetical protein
VAKEIASGGIQRRDVPPGKINTALASKSGGVWRGEKMADTSGLENYINSFGQAAQKGPSPLQIGGVVTFGLIAILALPVALISAALIFRNRG